MTVGYLTAAQLKLVQPGIYLSTNTYYAFEALKAAAKTQLNRTISVARPAGGYRSAAAQNAMHHAGSSLGTVAERIRWGLNRNSTVAIAVHPYGTHESGTRVDIVGTPMDAKFLALAAKFGFIREFGPHDPNHFKHDGKTAIKAPTKGKKMVSIEGVDYSYARPSAAAVKAADKKFVVRYITTPGASNKGISQAEYDSLKKAGIEIVVVFEGGAGDMKKGKNQGAADARAAQANLKAIKGLNDNLPVYFACDFDATPADQAAINAYLDGAASVIGRERVGIYGGYFPVKRAHDAKKATWLWQTYAWSGGKVLGGIHLYQYRNGVKLGTGTVDLCCALQSNYGQKGVTPKVVEDPKPAVQPAPVVTAPAKSDQAVADEANLGFQQQLAIKSNGTYYFKGTDDSDIFVYNPVSGTKRHVTGAEWELIKAYGHDLFWTMPQSEADKIPTAS